MEIETIVILLLGITAGFAGGWVLQNRSLRAVLLVRENEWNKVLEDARRAAESEKKEALLDARGQLLQTRTAQEKEIQE
ncbi:MAG TPA: Rnase Y domain-containing protein, partial [Nitrospiria bacterium]|nr:Rnase Y domain-containing protein [Nitrospiria bacterium]